MRCEDFFGRGHVWPPAALENTQKAWGAGYNVRHKWNVRGISEAKDNRNRAQSAPFDPAPRDLMNRAAARFREKRED